MPGLGSSAERSLAGGRDWPTQQRQLFTRSRIDRPPSQTGPLREGDGGREGGSQDGRKGEGWRKGVGMGGGGEIDGGRERGKEVGR